MGRKRRWVKMEGRRNEEERRKSIKTRGNEAGTWEEG
jgi:hypothetical protein